MPKAIQKKLSAFPRDIKPMLATLIDKPFDSPGWLYEVKWDGYRAIAYLRKGKADIRSRNNKNFNDTFYPVHDALKKWNVDAVVDGEIVVVDEKGVPDFGGLQNWRSEADGHLAFYAFDLLWLNGKDMMPLTLKERRAALKKIVPDAGHIIRLSETFDASGSSFFELAKKMQLEGIMAKKADSKYIPGNRSKDWLKIKTEKHQEAIIGGYTINKNTSKPFSSLLLGLYENGKFEPIGPVGTGFSIQQQKDIIKKLKPHITSKCPFATIPDFNKPSRFRPDPPKADVVWVRPKIVCEISYRELTKDKALRHPAFKGIREDKDPKDITWEKTTPATNTKHARIADKDVMHAPEDKERKTLLNPSEESQVRKTGGHEVKFQNLSKIYWPKEKITKRDMLNYYFQVAPFMIPYLKDRPQTLNRYPNGITGEAFYQKDVKGKVPDWIDTFPYHSEADGRDKEFIVCNTEASLLYIASLGCIEINPWSSRMKAPDKPDWCIIDLDPDKNTFNQVIEAARLTNDILRSIGVDSYCKTSGSTGLHIYIPLGAKYTYEDSKEFARKIATILHNQIPKYTSIERQTKNRGRKMYIDFLQNRPQATVAAVYSLRPKPGAPVSIPLHWDEVKKGLKILDFTIVNAIDRIREQGDIFKPVLGKGINLKNALKKIESVFGASL